jgi:Ca2+-binding RTX toxin-like protein
VVGRKALLSSSVVLGVVVALAWTSVATASTASMSEDDLTYAAGAGESNHALIFRSLNEFFIVDTGATITAGAGCATVDTHEVRCSITTPTPPGSRPSITVTASDLNDFVSVASVGLVDASLSGEGGNDEIDVGTDGNSVVDGGAGGDTLKAGAGVSHLIGGGGADVLSGEERVQGPGPAFVIADYSDRLNPVTADDDGVADDGEVGEGDNVIAVDMIEGGSAGDTLTAFRVRGRQGNDTLVIDPLANPDPDSGFSPNANGDSGDDVLTWGSGLNGFSADLEGGAGDDTLTAGPEAGFAEMFGDKGNDTINGAPRGEDIVGGPGNDTLRGRGGNDDIEGGRGNDHVYGGRGRDLIFAGPGDDVLRARDGRRDTVRGGPGHDRARIDRGLDDVTGVEVLF